MEIIVKKQYLRDLRKVPKPIFLAADTAIAKLRKAESLQKSGLDYKKMKGGKKGEDYYRIRIGDYRIGVELVMPTLIIITILHRGEMYKHFPPK